MIIYNSIAIRSSLRDQRRIRKLIARALGHHFLHPGNQPFYYFRRYRTLAKQWERQTWAFAYELLMPARRLEELLRMQMNDEEIRELFGVTGEFYQDRKQAFAGEWTGGKA